MAITMKNYGLRWTDLGGTPRASAVSYDKQSAEDRQAELVAARCTDVEIEETKPGQLLEPRG
ncbi:hypothetical protein ACFC0S_15895 [Streptomyces sp. NPDC056084]|uniref:hypothetical protein n=1 Tax=unclassified Streptomyces TaxID=2593676 RepID=UPI0035E165DC